MNKLKILECFGEGTMFLEKSALPRERTVLQVKDPINSVNTITNYS